MPSLTRYATSIFYYSMFECIHLSHGLERLDGGVIPNSKEMRPILTLGCPHSGGLMHYRGLK